MKDKKGFVIPLIVAVVVILAIIGGVFVYQNNKVEAPILVGGDKDEHGCIGSAGYSWCAVKNKCLRVWEEKCEATSSSTSENSFCGGIAGIKCATGFTCKYDGAYPDAGGKCVSGINN